MIDAEFNTEPNAVRPKGQFSIQRALLAIAIFAIAIALFQHAADLNVQSLATKRGPVAISIPALLIEWLASSIMVGGIAVIPFGRRGLVLGSLVGGACFPLLLIANCCVRAGGNI